MTVCPKEWANLSLFRAISRRGWRVTRARAENFLSSEIGPIEPKSWAILVGGWRVTAPMSRPPTAGFRAMNSMTSLPRVARDRPPPAASSGEIRAAARALRRDTALAPGYAVAARASCASLAGMQSHRRADERPMLRAQTNAGTPCIACWLLVACRAALAL